MLETYYRSKTSVTTANPLHRMHSPNPLGLTGYLTLSFISHEYMITQIMLQNKQLFWFKQFIKTP